MWRKIFILIAGLLMIAYLSVSIVFTESRRKEVKCTSVKITMPDEKYGKFFTDQEVYSLMGSSKKNLINKPINAIETKKFEEKLQRHTLIERADVYMTTDGTFHVDIVPRTPILRVINKHGSTFYIDKKGYIMNSPSGYVAYVPVATGNISQGQVKKSISVFSDRVESVVGELYKLAQYLEDNDFWRDQVDQILVDNRKDIRLIPRVGAHSIVLGNMDRYQEKFDNLTSFYLNGLNVIGWDKYDKINVKFKGQIVCTKK